MNAQLDSASARSGAGTSAGDVAPRRSFASRLFGYDLFISFALGPPPRGTQSYASDLARRLRERDFTVFFSEDEAPPGEQLDSTLRRALLSSKTLVVIANRGTLAEPRWVRTEVDEFRKSHPDRPVIAINVGAALQDPELATDAQAWLGYQDKIWLDESEETVAAGIASEALVERLATAPTRARSNVRWRWVVRAVGAGLAGLAIAAGIAAWQANRNATEANRQREAAVTNLDRAVVGEKLARENERKAKSETVRALKAEGDALTQKTRAEDEADKARKAEKRVREELRKSTALRLLAEARSQLGGARSEDDEAAMLKSLAAYRIAPGSREAGGLLDVLVHDGNLRKLILTGGAVTAAAFCRDGSCIVAGSDDGSLRMWDARSGASMGAPFATDKDWVASVAVSPDGSRIVSGGGHGSVQLWDARTHQPIGPTYRLHRGAVRGVAFRPDGNRVVTSADDGVLRVWVLDAKHGMMIGSELRGHAAAARAVAFSPDGKLIASGDDNGKLLIWSASDWENSEGISAGEPIAAHQGWVTCVAFSPDGSRIVSGGQDKLLRLWDAHSGKPIGEPLKGHLHWVNSCAFSPDGSRIISGGEDASVCMWDGKTGKPIGKPLQGHKSGITQVAFSPDGSRILSAGGYDNSLRLWDPRANGIASQFKVHGARVNALAFNPDGSRIVSGDDDGGLRLWDGRTGAPLGKPLLGHTAAVVAAAFSPDGTLLVSVGGHNALRRWSAKTGAAIAEPPRPDGTSGWGAFAAPAEERADVRTGVAITPDGRRILTGSTRGELQFHDAQTGRPLGPPIETRSVRSLALSRDGRTIAAGSDDDRVRLWNTASEKLIAQLAGHTGTVNSVAFSPDGKRLVSGSNDATLRLWNVRSHRAIGTPLTGHTEAVLAVAFSRDGHYIASGGGDYTMRLWDAAHWSGRSARP